MRTCVGCRVSRPGSELVRVGLDDGRLVLGKTPTGRGAWLCPGASCLDTAIRKRALGRALRVDLDPDLVEDLRMRFPVEAQFVKR